MSSGKRRSPRHASTIKLSHFQCDDGVDHVSSESEDDGLNEENVSKDCNSVIVDFNEKNYIAVNMYNKSLSGLIDSGADENTISLGMVEFLFDVKDLPKIYKSPYKHVVLADGKKRIRILGQLYLFFEIEGREFRSSFHIKDTEIRSVILGNRFLRTHQAVMDFSTNHIKLRSSSWLKSSKMVTLLPKEEIRMCARVEHAVPDGQLGFVEPERDSFCTINQLQVIESLSRVNRGEIVVGVLNENVFPVELKRGDMMGTFRLVEGELLGEIENHAHRFEVDERKYDSPMGHDESKVPQTWEEFQDNFKLDNPHVSAEQADELRGLLYEYRYCFYEYDGRMGHYVDEDVTIDIEPNAVPVRKRPYWVHPKFVSKLENEIQVLLRQGVVEPSYGDWASPALVVPKPGRPEEIRLVVDFRGVNKLVQKDLHPLPRMEDVFEQVSSSQPKYFSSLDLQSGYFQLNLDNESRKYTAFCTPQHSLRFTRVPQDLCISGQRFQRVMNKVFQGMINKFIVVYLDDILIYSSSLQEHLDHLRMVFERLTEANLKLNASKCQFITVAVKFLGPLITREGVMADSRICEAVKNCPQPTNVTGIRRFIGLTSFYRKFIKNFSIIARPQHELTKTDKKFVWSDKCQQAFLQLKDALCEPPVLAHQNFDLPFILYTDKYAAGFCLCQVNELTEEHVIACGGRYYLKYQQNYAVTEKEMLASYLGILHFDYYLPVYFDHGSECTCLYA